MTKDLNKYSPWSDEPVYAAHGRTVEELKKTKELVYRSFYMRPLFILKRLRNLLRLPPGRILKLIHSGLVMTFSKN
ncbi:MAG TPA: hypothetical protein PLK76_01330 [bacterium]|nr:hypothetical protein [bacterium]